MTPLEQQLQELGKEAKAFTDEAKTLRTDQDRLRTELMAELKAIEEGGKNGDGLKTVREKLDQIDKIQARLTEVGDSVDKLSRQNFAQGDAFTRVDLTYHCPERGRRFPSAEAAVRFYHTIACGLFGRKESRDYCEKHDIPVTWERGDDKRLDCRAAVIGDDESGGLLLPPDAGRLIIDLAMQYGKFEANAMVEPMSTNEKPIFVHDDGVQIYFLDELEELTEEEIKFRRVLLTAKRLGAYTAWSAEFEQDVQAWSGEKFVELFARAYAKKKDQCGFVGDGTSSYGGIVGILNHTDTVLNSMPDTKTSFSDLTYDDLIATQLSTPPETREELDRCKWFMHPDQVLHVAGLTYPGKETRILSESRNARGRFELLGYEIVEVGVYPDEGDDDAGVIMLSFGSLWHSCVVGNRMSLRVKVSNELLWLKDGTALGVMGRFDIKVHTGRHVAHLKTADA